jgi:hypothetical protein
VLLQPLGDAARKSLPQEAYYDGRQITIVAQFPNNPPGGDKNSNHIRVWPGSRPASEVECLWMAFFSGADLFAKQSSSFIDRGIFFSEDANFESFDYEIDHLSPKHVRTVGLRTLDIEGTPGNVVSTFEWLEEMEFGALIGPRRARITVVIEHPTRQEPVLETNSVSTVVVTRTSELKSPVGFRSQFAGRTVVDDHRLTRVHGEPPIVYNTTGSEVPAADSDFVRSQVRMQRPQSSSGLLKSVFWAVTTVSFIGLLAFLVLTRKAR